MIGSVAWTVMPGHLPFALGLESGRILHVLRTALNYPIQQDGPDLFTVGGGSLHIDERAQLCWLYSGDVTSAAVSTGLEVTLRLYAALRHLIPGNPEPTIQLAVMPLQRAPCEWSQSHVTEWIRQMSRGQLQARMVSSTPYAATFEFAPLPMSMAVIV